MRSKAFRFFLVGLGLTLTVLGMWGAAVKARELIHPPEPLPYALDQLTANQPDGAGGLVPLDSAEMPAFAPTLEDEIQPERSNTPAEEPAADESSTPAPPPPPPISISIPSLRLSAPIVEAEEKIFTINNSQYKQWQAPDVYAAGWSKESGAPGQGTNIVLFGHHNVNGAVFADLYRLKKGDLIQLTAGDQTFTYVVRQTVKVKERGVSFSQMVENAAWLLPTRTERLTLVTCWPPYESTYRLIVVALPESNGDSRQAQ